MSMKLAVDHICPRCGGAVPNYDDKGRYPGALSRTDNHTEICSRCGTMEALENFGGEPALPQEHWLINGGEQV